MPYVPTPVFNTPLPSKTHNKGPRAARSGREGGRGGAHGPSAATGGDKAAPGQTAGAPSAKNAPSADKGRNDVNGTKDHAAPAQTRASNTDETTPQSEPRKAQQAGDRSRGENRAKGNDEASTGQTGRHVNGNETFPRHHKPFPRNYESSSQKTGDHSRSGPHFQGDNQNGPRAPANRFESPIKTDFHRRDFSQAEPFGKDFHKDRDHPRERGETRPERGRGGHRGRGNYHVPQNAQFGNAHLPQQPFIPQKPYFFNDRHGSHYGHSNNSHQGQRLSMRSPSVPTTPAPYYGIYSFPPVDPNAMYGYPFMPMTAVPYQQYAEPLPLISMISMQM